MKNMIKFACILVLLISQNLTAQDAMTPMAQQSSDKKFNISVNPLSLIFGAINANIDMKMTDKITAGLSLGYAGASAGSVDASAFSLGVRADFYLTSQALTNSFYAAPIVEFAFFNADSGDSKASATALDIGLLGGYKWFWQSGFNISLGGGIGWISIDADLKADDGTTISVPGSISGTRPRLEFALGYAF